MTYSSRNWNAPVLSQFQYLIFKSFVGTKDHFVCSSEYGYGKNSLSLMNLGGKEHRREIRDMVHLEHNDRYHAKAVTLGVQGAWTRWSDFVRKDLSWKNVLFQKSHLVKFCIGATYDTLSTPNNLHRIGLIDDPKCFLCQEDSCSLVHAVLPLVKVGLRGGMIVF